MADPQVVLEERFSAALATLGPAAAGADPVVRPSQHADFQMNGAMPLAKVLGLAPRDIAQALRKTVDLEGIASATEVAGPGFVNITLTDAFIAECLEDMRSPMCGVRPSPAPERVVIDYSAPNVAKEMHVGHLRSTVIGDSLARILALVGNTVIRQNHIGDWGTPFGMLIEHMLDLGEDHAAHELSVSDLNAFYQQARQKFDRQESFAERARGRVVALQAGDPETMRLWRLLVDHSQSYFGSIYETLAVSLTDQDYRGESTYNAELESVVDELADKGLLVEDDGALCVFPPGFENREGEPLPVIVQKRDGGFGYAATDLAALRYRTKDLGATLVLYVVGAPQADHLNMTFAVAEMAGWLALPARAEHVAFGSVLGADGRMFRSRAGETVRLGDLLDEGIQRALAAVKVKNPDLDPEQMALVAHAVGTGAVKYADLSTERIQDYTFDWDRMLALNGNTAPYLQYAHARCRAIFRKGGIADPRDGDPVKVVIVDRPERDLAMKLAAFDSAVQSTIEGLRPHRLCTYLFELAQVYSRFFEGCPVLKAETPEIRQSRLDLVDLTARVMSAGLGLLGIETPTPM